MNTTYKGFTIQHPAADGGRYHVAGDEFNPEGYATINTAKGAITKHDNARTAKHNAGMGVLAEKWAEQDAEQGRAAPATSSKAASSDDSARATVHSITQPAQGWTQQRNTKGDPIHADPRMASAYALLDYIGATKESDKRSRAKREGVNPNRKRKSYTQARRNHYKGA